MVLNIIDNMALVNPKVDLGTSWFKYICENVSKELIL